MVQDSQLVEAHEALEAGALEIPAELKREIQVQDVEHVEGEEVTKETVH